MFGCEVDYDLEVYIICYFCDVLVDDLCFVVLEVYSDYFIYNIFCLFYEEGVYISDLLVVLLSQECCNFLGCVIMELCCWEVFEWNKMQIDLNFGNYLMCVGDDGQDKIVLLDFGVICDFDDEVLGFGCEMICVVWLYDSECLFGVMCVLEFFDGEVLCWLLDDFVVLCFEVIEVLQDLDCFLLFKFVVNDKGEYLWGESNFFNWVMNWVSCIVLLVYFDVLFKEFIFLFCKLFGVYIFLYVIKVQVCGNIIFELFIYMWEDEDCECVV